SVRPGRSGEIERSAAVGQAGDVGDAIDAAGGQLILQLALDPGAGGRVVEDGRAHADQGGAGQHQLQSVASGADAADADDRDLRQGLAGAPDAPDRDGADGRAGQATGPAGQGGAHGGGVDDHARHRVDHGQAVGAGGGAGAGHGHDVGNVRGQLGHHWDVVAGDGADGLDDLGRGVGLGGEVAAAALDVGAGQGEPAGG